MSDSDRLRSPSGADAKAIVRQDGAARLGPPFTHEQIAAIEQGRMPGALL